MDSILVGKSWTNCVINGLHYAEDINLIINSKSANLSYSKYKLNINDYNNFRK